MKKLFLLISLIIISFSCVRNVDYDQVDNAIFSTPMSVAYLQLDLNQHDFLDNNSVELTQVEKLYLIDLTEVFNESSTNSLDYVTQYINTFDRDFYCEFEFRDTDSLLVLTTPRFLIPATTIEPIEQTLTFEERDFDQFISAKWITVKVDLESGFPIVPTEDNDLEIQSVIHFDYEITPSS